MGPGARAIARPPAVRLARSPRLEAMASRGGNRGGSAVCDPGDVARPSRPCQGLPRRHRLRAYFGPRAMTDAEGNKGASAVERRFLGVVDVEGGTLIVGDPRAGSDR